MQQHDIRFRLETSFRGELTDRLPGTRVVIASDLAETEAPFVILEADEAKETSPESGVYYVKLLVLIVHDVGEHDPETHAALVESVTKALQSFPRGAEDRQHGLRLYNFVILQTTPANTERERATALELNVGCGLIERGEGGPTHVPDAESQPGMPG